MVLVNADGLVMGRVASFCAKKALEKEEVVVVNAEKVVLTGTKNDLLHKYKTKFDRNVKGNPEHGPKFSRMPDRVMRSSIRGMVPIKRKTGKDAIARVKVFIGTPAKYKDQEVVDLSKFKVDETRRYVVLGELTKLLGAKW